MSVVIPPVEVVVSLSIASNDPPSHFLHALAKADLQNFFAFLRFVVTVFPSIDPADPAGTPRIQVSHPGVPASPGGGVPADRWKKREEKTWSQQLPQETTIMQG